MRHLFRDPRKRFLLVFALLVGALYAVIVIPWVDRHAVAPLTRGIAAVTALTLRSIGQQVTTNGTTVVSPSASVNIENGCNGLEAVVILAAAVLAFPTSWRQRGLAVIVGVIGIQLLNIVRTTSLFLFLKYRPDWFQILHTGVWQTVLVVAALGFFVFWSGRQRMERDETPG